MTNIKFTFFYFFLNCILYTTSIESTTIWTPYYLSSTTANYNFNENQERLVRELQKSLQHPADVNHHYQNEHGIRSPDVPYYDRRNDEQTQTFLNNRRIQNTFSQSQLFPPQFNTQRQYGYDHHQRQQYPFSNPTQPDFRNQGERPMIPQSFEDQRYPPSHGDYRYGIDYPYRSRTFADDVHQREYRVNQESDSEVERGQFYFGPVNNPDFVNPGQRPRVDPYTFYDRKYPLPTTTTSFSLTIAQQQRIINQHQHWPQLGGFNQPPLTSNRKHYGTEGFETPSGQNEFRNGQDGRNLFGKKKK